MNVINKIVKGDDVRISRLHTESGDWCGLAALSGLIPSAVTWLNARFFGVYAREPWWVWDAITYLEARLKRTDSVLEVGAGYSTLWLAKRCGNVLAIEEDDAWKERVKREAVRSNITNITLHSEDSLSAFHRFLPQLSWDLIIIDGLQRFDIFQYMLGKGATPRLIIYDDTDKMENRDALKSYSPRYQMRVFRGFKPQTVHACETTVFERIGA